MDPAISGLHAFFANMFVRVGEFDLIEMRAIHEILRQIFKSDQCPYKPSIDNLKRNKNATGRCFQGSCRLSSTRLIGVGEGKCRSVDIWGASRGQPGHDLLPICIPM